jgi:hypothetical protein
MNVWKDLALGATGSAMIAIGIATGRVTITQGITGMWISLLQDVPVLHTKKTIGHVAMFAAQYLRWATKSGETFVNKYVEIQAEMLSIYSS